MAWRQGKLWQNMPAYPESVRPGSNRFAESAILISILPMTIFRKALLATLLLLVSAIVFVWLRPPRFAYLTDDSPTDTTETTVTATLHPDGREAELLSSFYGLESALPNILNRFIHPQVGGKDGMPVVFSHELDRATLQAGDFKVTRASGEVGEITCVTLAPANDLGELRTVLLVGEYGSIDDQPLQVEIVGDLLSKDHEVNFRGRSVGVVPLEAGPSIALAQVVPESEWEIGKAATRLPLGGGSGCPPGTKQVVRVTWEGGVTKPGNDEIDDKERQLYKVTVRMPDGSTTEVTPFAIADLGDSDNNHRLCLDVDGVPLSVSFPGGHVTDPREDLNPDTRVEVIGVDGSQAEQE